MSWYESTHSHPDTESPSEKTEIFALGSTFYEILTGRKPYEGRDDAEVERAFRQGDFPSLKALPALGAIISNCWSGQFETLTDLLRDIKQEGTSIQQL